MAMEGIDDHTQFGFRSQRLCESAQRPYARLTPPARCALFPGGHHERADNQPNRQESNERDQVPAVADYKTAIWRNEEIVKQECTRNGTDDDRPPLPSQGAENEGE